MEWDNAEALIDANFEEGLKYIDPYGRSILHIAISTKAPTRIIKKLIEKQLDPNLNDIGFRRSVIHLAVFMNATPEVFRLLLVEGKGDPNIPDKVRF
jgi:hypothetical protein